MSYDEATDTWGDAEMVLSAEETGRTVLLARPSPDGRFLLFCMADRGYFPVFRASSDLYMMDLASGEYWPCEANSEESESWHSWSANGRWVAFSSKRVDGVYTRVYLAHVDENGRMGKPFVLPQADPTHDDSFLRTYSVPEFLESPPGVAPADIAHTITARNGVAAAMPDISMAAKPSSAGSPAPERDAYLPSEAAGAER